MHYDRRAGGNLMRAFGFLMCTLSAAIAATTARAEGVQLGGPTVFDLPLGAHATELPTGPFTGYACGTEGGPPGRPLAGWTGYAACAPEAATGFREVYFEYDNERQYVAWALGLGAEAAPYQPTSAYDIPVIASALFDGEGFQVGLRLVSDPRVAVEVRERGSALGAFLIARYGGDWSCSDIPATAGEQPYRGALIKTDCELSFAGEGTRLRTEIRQLRRAGQSAVDRDTNLPTAGQFESSTRFEMVLDGGVRDRAARLAAFAARPASPPSQGELLVERAMNCPGCDLAHADLKRANLANARLAGANLAGANLHEANLSGADLSGANLEGANINHATLRRAVLAGASLRNAMLYETRLDGADLRGADLSFALAGAAHFPGAQLDGAALVDADFRAARINDADLRGADLRGAWFDGAQMMRSDLSDADLSAAILPGANLAGAVLLRTDLRQADLIRADLRGADLSAADLRGARLTFANLAGATTTAAIVDAAAAGGEPPAS